MEQHSYSGDQFFDKRPEVPNNTYQDQRRHTLHGTDWTFGLDMDRLNSYPSITGHSKASTEATSSDEDSENEEAISENDYKLGSASTSSSENTAHPFDYAKDLGVRSQKQSYLNPGDTFGRRASMSQLSLYGDVWGQAPSGKYDLSLPVPIKTGSGPLDIPGDMGAFIPYQPSLAQSRRNSRILPNPIQPPSTLHGRKLSVEEQSEPPPLSHSSLSLSEHTIPEEEQLMPRVNGGAMLGGFVPGFDIWARKDSSLHPQSTQSQRRKSESVLHDLSAFADDHLIRSVSSTTAPSASGNAPLDRRISTSLLPTSQAPDPPGNTYSPSLHPHFATSDEGHGMGGSEMCGLCGVQKAIMSLGACGHRVCNVCHRHEKHRSARLFQSATPPCPFCAHGVTTDETIGPDKIQHQRKSLPVISPHTFNPHPLTQFQQQAFQGHGSYGGQGHAPGNDSSDGYPYNRQYHPTYPMYTHTAPLLRTGSGPSEMSMSTRLGVAQFGHGHYQPTHMKPPTGPMMKPSSAYAKGNYAPTFQPSNPYGMDMGRMGSMDNMNMGRPGMIALPNVNWREGPTQDFVNDQFHRSKHQNYAPCHLPSFSMIPNLPPAIPPTVPRTEAFQWAVVRVTNNVHILMDRATGKTFNSAFVELALTSVDAGMVAQVKNLKVLKGRVVTVELSSQDELMRSVFPKWVGLFENGEPLNPGDLLPSYEGQESDGAGAMSTPPLATPPFVTRDEINALLVVCRNYKLHFSRKCAERPFENILSILAKYPWHQPHRVLPLHRDHIFELLKLSIESLRMHLNKEYNTIHSTLLIRMVRCAILTPAFTERQKAMVLHVAGCACPEDIIGWMAPPVAATESESSLSSETTIDGSEDRMVASTMDVSSKDSYEVEDCDSTLEIEEQVESLDINDETKRSSQETSSPVHLTHTLVSWASVAAPTSKEAKVNNPEDMVTDSYALVMSFEANDVHHQGTSEVSLNTAPLPITSEHSRGQSLSWSEVTSQGSSKTGTPRLPAGVLGFSFPLESPSKEPDRPKGLPSPVEYRNEDAGNPNLQPNTASTPSTMSYSASTAFPFPLAKGSHRRGSLPRISVSRSSTVDSPGSPSSSTNGTMSTSSSASILEAIKTITQSTPRLAKGSMSGPKHHSQCREGGETL
ncbi:hypothetical protein BGZ82_006494 [Podila clonocystis]|nr:hypothetical protein BGZ82_006494 [Podila clonocystis]